MGVAGLNLEDSRDDGSLVPAAHQCAVIAAVKARVPELFVNARTDTCWLAGAESWSLAETVRFGSASSQLWTDNVYRVNGGSPGGGRAPPALHPDYEGILPRLTLPTGSDRGRETEAWNRSTPGTRTPRAR
jgi:phosphoenolpyruvate phosphomutase-like protein